MQAAVEAAAAADGGLRICICCAGTGWAQKLAGSRGPHPLEPFAVVVAINLIGTFNVLRLASRRCGHRAARGRRARGVRQHRVDRRLRRTDRPGRLLRVQGRRRRHDAARRARPRAGSASAWSRLPPASSTPRCWPRCRRGARPLPGDAVPAAARPPGRVRAARADRRDRISTARSSGSTARCGWRRAETRGSSPRRRVPITVGSATCPSRTSSRSAACSG